MKKYILVIFSLLFLGALVACSDQTVKVEETQKDIIDVVRLKKQLNIGLTEIEIESLLGSEFTKVKSSYDDSILWRFDFGTNSDYISPDDEYDFGDLDGLKLGTITAQLFVSWDLENKVSSYSIIYFNEEDAKVYNYRVFSHGEEKEEAITE